MSHAHVIATGTDARAFLLAGNARVTLVSGKSGARFTYRVRSKTTDDGRTLHFVAVLNGPDNGSDFAYVGTIFDGEVFRHGRKSRIAETAPSVVAFAWAFRYLAEGSVPPNCEVWHEGRCGRCGRALTVPESIASGIGPVCAAA